MSSAMEHEKVADHYNARPNETRDSRRQSRIYHLRSFNNWLKNVLIDLHTRPGYSALDLCCGKGGDLQKWINTNISTYVGCDIAKESVKKAVDRYNESFYKKCSFRPKFYVADLCSVRLSSHFQDSSLMFDIVSAQFSIHYAFENEQYVRTFLQNVSDRLKSGGFFVGTTIDSNVLIRKIRAVDEMQISSACYHIKFDDRHKDKKFPISNRKEKQVKSGRKKRKRSSSTDDDENEKTLKKSQSNSDNDDEEDKQKDKQKDEEKEDSMNEDDTDKNNSSSNDDEGDNLKKNYPYGIRYTFSLDQNVVECPEYIVHFPTFKQLALEYDLELVMLCNFHDFFTEFSSDQYPNYRRLLSTMKVVDENGTISPDEWDAIYLYTAFAFKKKGAVNSTVPSDPVTRKQWDQIDKDEITIIKS